jgi:hypothetical protein
MADMHKVIGFKQATLKTCWEGAAHTMYIWKYGQGAKYQEAARKALRNVDKTKLLIADDNGLEVEQFYLALGLARKEIATEDQLLVVLLHSPVIFIKTAPPAHAVVLTGKDDTGLWVMDPWDGTKKHLDYSDFQGAFSPIVFYWPWKS